jgi:hypothetical protein
MSAPVSATITSAVSVLTPGMVHNKVTAASRGRSRSLISSLSTPIEWSRKSMWARIRRATALWWLSQRPSNASTSAGILARILPLASSANRSGEVSPSMRASIIARADWDHTRDATDDNLIPASCNSFSSRWISWPRAVIWVLR